MQDDIEKFQQFMQEQDAPENDSGRGPESSLPAELRGLNWGALILQIAWGIPMRVHIAWLCLIPFVNMVFPFVLWIKGNEWAWANRKWKSIEHFRQVQDRWAFWGFVILGITVVGYLILMSWIQSVINTYLPNIVI